MYQDFSSRYFIRETHKTRDPLADIDSLADVETMVHGESKMPADAGSSKNIDTKIAKDNKGNEPSDSDIRLESQEGNEPFKGPNVKDPLLKDMKTDDSILEIIRKEVEG